eukprot:3644574-Pyramimonas_sp.AAC.1
MLCGLHLGPAGALREGPFQSPRRLPAPAAASAGSVKAKAATFIDNTPSTYATRRGASTSLRVKNQIRFNAVIGAVNASCPGDFSLRAGMHLRRGGGEPPRRGERLR